MKILFLASYFPAPNNPSRGNWALEQAEAFNCTHQTTVLCLSPWAPKALAFKSKSIKSYADIPKKHRFRGVDAYYLRWLYYPLSQFEKFNRQAPEFFLWLGWLSVRRQIGDLILSVQPDVIYAHHTLVNGYVALQIQRLYDIPYISTDHEIGDYIKSRENPRYRKLFYKIATKASSIVTVSKKMQQQGEALFPEIRFKTIYNGSSFPIAEKEVHKKPRLTIFCCSKFYGRKDIPLLLDAFHALCGKHSTLRLRIAGDGPDRAIIESHWKKIAKRGNVQLLGLLAPSAVRGEMLGADIFALVGWAEPFGVVFLEAMACGLPVVVSEDAGIAEVLTDGENCIFSKPRDLHSVIHALSCLIEDIELRRKIGKGGQRLFRQRFQWPQVANQYFEEFDKAREACTKR